MSIIFCSSLHLFIGLVAYNPGESLLQYLQYDPPYLAHGRPDQVAFERIGFQRFFTAVRTSIGLLYSNHYYILPIPNH